MGSRQKERQGSMIGNELKVHALKPGPGTYNYTEVNLTGLSSYRKSLSTKLINTLNKT